MHYGDLGDLLDECPTVLQVKCIASVVLKQHCERYHLFFYHVVTLVGRLSCCLTSRLYIDKTHINEFCRKASFIITNKQNTPQYYQY